MESSDEEGNIFIKRFHFHTQATSVQLHQFCGDNGFVVNQDDQLGLAVGDRIVRLAVGKKFTDIRNLNRDAILGMIPHQDKIKVAIDVLTGNYPRELDLLQVTILLSSNIFFLGRQQLMTASQFYIFTYINFGICLVLEKSGKIFWFR